MKEMKQLIDKKIIVELIVVIIGVLIAFQLTRVFKSKDDQSTKEQYIELCKLQLNDISKQFEGLEIVKKEWKEWIDQENSGKNPHLKNMNIYVSYNKILLESLLDNAKFSPETNSLISSIIQDFESFKGFSDRLHSYNVGILLPNIDKEKDFFYDKKTGRLKEKFQWYVDYIVLTPIFWDRIQNHIELLNKELEKE